MNKIVHLKPYISVYLFYGICGQSINFTDYLLSQEQGPCIARNSMTFSTPIIYVPYQRKSFNVPAFSKTIKIWCQHQMGSTRAKRGQSEVSSKLVS